MIHKPVLIKEIIKFFDPKKGDIIVDCTVGAGGHSNELKKYGAKVIGIDLGPKFDWVIKANFKDLKKIIKTPVKGILFDLGLCSWHLEKSGKGFSFQKDEPLDMRFGDSELTANQIINNYNKKQLKEIFRYFGEEKDYKKITEKIIENRPIKSTKQLADLLPDIKTKARIFQAIRIAVNDELRNLADALPQAMELADKVAVISYHSLEDRIVKLAFKNKKLIRPSAKEIKDNPRARSAKLRIYET